MMIIIISKTFQNASVGHLFMQIKYQEAIGTRNVNGKTPFRKIYQ